MGAKHGKPAEPPKFLDTPWRKINWKDKQSDLQYVKNYKPHIEGQQLRILLYGPVGAGKSSFINTVQGVLRGRMFRLALVAPASGSSFTKEYSTYKMETETPNTFHPFVFNDIMGLEQKEGVLVDDVRLALMGRMKEGYTFKTESKLSEGDQFYNNEVDPNDKVHVLVCVVPANTVEYIEEKVVEKIQEIRREASRLGIPQVVIITKIDETCPEIQKDLRSIYKSTIVKEKIEQFSTEVGIPMNCIFPVKNNTEENKFNDDAEILIMNALKRIIADGDDFINHKLNNP